MCFLVSLQYIGNMIHTIISSKVGNSTNMLSLCFECLKTILCCYGLSKEICVYNLITFERYLIDTMFDYKGWHECIQTISPILQLLSTTHLIIVRSQIKLLGGLQTKNYLNSQYNLKKL